MATIVTRAGLGSPLSNNQVDSNFINLNTDKAELSGATFTGDVASTGFSGDITGAVLFQAKAGEGLTKGDPVYISGISGNTTVVSKADANDANKMPCFGIVDATVSINANCSIVTFGSLADLNTSAFSEGDELYISDTGTLSATAPTGEASQLQKIAKVTRSHASAGSIKVMGAGRTNATPNLDDGKFFLGNSSNQSASATFSTSVTGIALPLSGGVMSGAITTNSTFDGRDVATDGTKLDGIEASATADQTGAQIKTAYEAETNAFTDAQFTKLGGIEASATADQTAAEIRALVESATDSNVFTDADHTKLNGVEASADVTDTANVTAAGALMDSELTSIASVKALNQGVATGDSPTFAAVTSTGEITANGGIALGDSDKATFGAGDDLEIYHDGSNSYIDEAGTGTLYVRADSATTIANPSNTLSARFRPSTSVSLYYNGSEKLATTSTGIDVTGTATVDGLTVDGAPITANAQNAVTIGFSGAEGVISADRTGGNFGELLLKTTAGSAPLSRLKIAYNGDISFYEDTGTTAKFFWDASAESLGIGTSSPSSKLEVAGSANSTYLTVGGDDSSNGRGLTFTSSASASFNGAVHTIRAPSSQGVIALSTHDTERARLTSTGDFLVGKQTGSSNSVGFEVSQTGNCVITRSGGQPLMLNRQASNGDIILLRKDGSPVGSIGTNGGVPYFSAGTAGGLKFSYIDSTSAVMFPVTTTGAIANGVHDLGYANAKFRDLYLSSGVYLGGTGAANKLDDYEEGVHVTTFSGTGTVGLTSASLNYTKVGRMVTVGGQVQVTSQSGVSGGMRLTLPFAGHGLEVGAVRLYGVNFTDTARGPICYVSGANLEFAMSRDNATSTTIPVTTNGYYMFSITYQTN